jgi:3-methyladenine DNA glycosylase Mpg
LRPPLTIRKGIDVPDADVAVSPRIGITRAAALKGRYFVRDNPYVSRTPTNFVTEPYAVASRAARRDKRTSRD